MSTGNDQMTFPNEHRFRFGFSKNLGMRLSWIDEQLEARGMNRRELAERIGLSEAQMSKIMGGTRTLKADEADAIRRVFGYLLPDDPGDEDTMLIHDCLSKLGESQKRAVVLYLKALLGDDVGPRQAS